MLNNIKYAIAFALGIGGGIISCHLYYSKIVNDLFEHIEELNEQINNLSKAEIVLENLYNICKEYGLVSEEDNSEMENDKNEDISISEPVEETKVEENETTYEEVVKTIKKEEKKMGVEKDIEVISMEEFMNDTSGYDRLTINYYEEDDTLADENEEIITNVENLVGDEALYFEDNENVVYVRNNKIGALLEILLVHGSYARDVLGIVDR